MAVVCKRLDIGAVEYVGQIEELVPFVRRVRHQSARELRIEVLKAYTSKGPSNRDQ